jgi:hypothetical protein
LVVGYASKNLPTFVEGPSREKSIKKVLVLQWNLFFPRLCPKKKKKKKALTKVIGNQFCRNLFAIFWGSSLLTKINSHFFFLA